MKNKNYSSSEFCKFHKTECEFICSCGDYICLSCIEIHKTHNDFVLKTKRNIFQELNNEIKELELNYEYISNSFHQEKILIKLVKDLTKKFFRKELKNSKDKEILKILCEMKISLNRANLEYKYDYRYPENFEIKNIKLMIEKSKRNFLKKLNKIQKCADRILCNRNVFEAEYEKLLRRLFSADDVKMDVDDSENKELNHNTQTSIQILSNKIDNFQFTIGATKVFNPEGTDKIFQPINKEFVQSFYSDKEIEKNENYLNNYIEIGNEDLQMLNNNNLYKNKINLKKFNFDELESTEADKKSSGIKSRNGDIQIPIIVSNNNLQYGSEIFDDKIYVGKEIDNNYYHNNFKKDVVINSAVNSNYIYNQKYDNNNIENHTIYQQSLKIGEDSRPTSISNLSRSPTRPKSPSQVNRMSGVIGVESEIDMVCLNPICRKNYKVKKGEEKWKRKCLNCYKIEKASS
jgi:hypothetical protein